ncbi:hypothetical protein FB567DRAFT_529649 [Paraphoma chrysanthemicola]|uniref:AAA+ ATPase domain-containing protein n=1 Tax=Paraphoma chrysanthemicola TaxID=798071 RepID=A0A8K0R0R5_9PLEO|nr:hypothetical protein FB567DRAFT_529649 [Paraphoma chrysanthemicola]
MALTAVRPAMNNEEKQSLHPFFSKPLQKKSSLEDLHTIEAPADDPHHDPDYEQQVTSAQPEKTRKKRTRKTNNLKEGKGSISSTKGQPLLEHFARPARPNAQDGAASSNGGVTYLAVTEEGDQDRRKRRKTESPGPAEPRPMPVQGLDWHEQLQVEVQAESSVQPMPTSNGVEALLRVSTPPPVDSVVEDPLILNSAPGVENTKMLPVTPKKHIKVTKNGKLVSSPPKPKPEEATTPKKRRGRKPAKAKSTSTITVIKYGSDSANRHSIGGRIEAILRGRSKTGEHSAALGKGPPKPVLPPKSTHPFFVGKAGQKADAVSTKPAVNQRPPTPRKSAVTPGKLRAETYRDRSPGPVPAFGMTLGVDRVAKQSGLHEASWPTRETAHVRNTDDELLSLLRHETATKFISRPRKAKNRTVTLRHDEEVLARLAVDLAPDIQRNHTANKLDFAPPEDVRLPTRVLTTGSDIQRLVFEHIKGQAAPDSHPIDLGNVHTAVKSLFDDIEHTLTPFDEGKCESQTWTQKYSPRQASHVLQTGKEATVLRDWLQNLTVMSVGGAHDSLKGDTSDAKRPPKKKRKKAVDDFIVSDDELEDEDMIEVSDSENKTYMKSIRRPRWTRNNNVIVISGPHGCGKSATVYAVAKEMDFEVFEINSSTRRSGKDIQDKVGDMTANHLVNHKRPEIPAKEEVPPAVDGDTERMDAACQKDIDSGRQGTMMNFFKAGPTTQSVVKAKPKAQQSKKSEPKSTQGMLPHVQASRKTQKQSLILFEEADVIFDEDQQFWTSVTKLAAQSKRPIIVTCNDERQIPMQDLPLAAILRLRPTPTDLATDYMLAMAGREGHILERRAVSDLYHSKNLDLRASITELDLWCQMSVGDRKGGLEWMYQRWPPGKDVDSQGRLLRVASEATYQSGMGWLSHNVFEANNNAMFDKEEELLSALWADWDISPTEWQKSPPQLSNATSTNNMHALERLDTLSESLSAADAYCRVDLPSYERYSLQPCDPTQPDIPDKVRLSYTLAAPLLQIEPQIDFLQFDAFAHTYTHLLAERAFSDLSMSSSSPANERPSTEKEYISELLETKERLSQSKSLCRLDYAAALDILAAPPDATIPERTSFILTPSSFDRTFSIITLDLAPYVRSIVAHEQLLESQRIRLSNLLSGGGTGKRPRTTRASRVALEGGVRETKRRDRWFDKGLNFELVMATAGETWSGMGWKGEGEGEDVDDGTGSMSGTQDSITGSQDVMMQDAQDN